MADTTLLDLPQQTVLNPQTLMYGVVPTTDPATDNAVPAQLFLDGAVAAANTAIAPSVANSAASATASAASATAAAASVLQVQTLINRLLPPIAMPGFVFNIVDSLYQAVFGIKTDGTIVMGNVTLTDLTAALITTSLIDTVSGS